MINVNASQFKLVLIFTISLAAAICAYVVWAVVDFDTNQVLHESRFLAEFSERAISRYQADPTLFLESHDTEPFNLLGGGRVNMALGYAQLKNKFPFIPPESQFTNHAFKAVVSSYRGPFKAPNFVLILPTYFETGERLYSYIYVDEYVNSSKLDLQVLEKIQPAIYIALISVFLLVIVELFHINKVNTNIHNFAHWANQLNTGVSSPPVPEFSSSKYSYMAFAIDKSLSGISEMLEKEQSFAKFTSHELRTPIAVLSANLELLELMMKDLSPQERSVLKNMDSAVSDMKYQMEALLWLSRESEEDFEYVLCVMKELVEKALQDNAYLVKNKNFSTQIIGTGGAIKSNPIFLQIILNNLVRNAYQNTENGIVNIELTANSITIENINNANSSPAKKNMGFGIGLALVDKLVGKLGLNYQVEIREAGRRVTLIFE